MSAKKNLLLIAGIVLFLISGACLYTIDEGQRGLLLRLGEIVLGSDGKPAVKTPGIHFKLPFVTRARIFDVRLQTLDIESSRITTAEKKDVLVDYYAKWKISNVALYFTRTGGNEFAAETLLRQKFNDGLRAEFGKRDIQEVVSGERSDIMATLSKQANESAKSLGIEVVDVRIKRIDLPTEVSSAVYDRMRAERERVATEHRAEGKSASEAIRSKADAEVTVLIGKANSESQQVRGEGDAMAAKIYADAYSKNAEFFEFYRSINAYVKTFRSNNDILVLKPNGQFFKYFNSAKGNGSRTQ